MFLLLVLLLFHCLQYSNMQGWAERNGTDAGGAATPHGTGGQVGEQRRGEQGTETGGRPEKRRGGFLDERADGGRGG